MAWSLIELHIDVTLRLVETFSVPQTPVPSSKGDQERPGSSSYLLGVQVGLGGQGGAVSGRRWGRAAATAQSRTHGRQPLHGGAGAGAGGH